MTAVLGAASMASALAQTVYSVNAVGYVNVTVPAGKFAMLANPLNAATNTIIGVLPDVPNGTVVYVFDNKTSSFAGATKRSATSWSGTGVSGATALAPGQGFFLKNAGTTDLTITFVGEVPQGTLSTSYVAGYNVVGSQVPQSGLLETDLGYKAATGDIAYIFDSATQAYTTYTKRATSWTSPAGAGEPTVNVASGFFLNAKAAGTWTRTFSVN